MDFNPPAGLYDDPFEVGKQRWWDGNRWGEQPGKPSMPSRTRTDSVPSFSGTDVSQPGEANGSETAPASICLVENSQSWKAGRRRTARRDAARVLLLAAILGFVEGYGFTESEISTVINYFRAAPILAQALLTMNLLYFTIRFFKRIAYWLKPGPSRIEVHGDELRTKSLIRAERIPLLGNSRFSADELHLFLTIFPPAGRRTRRRMSRGRAASPVATKRSLARGDEFFWDLMLDGGKARRLDSQEAADLLNSHLRRIGAFGSI